MTTLVGNAIGWASEQLRRGEHWFIDAKRATYGTSVARVIYGLIVVLFVVANFSNRDYLWGSASSWVEPIQHFNTWGIPFNLFVIGMPEWTFTALFVVMGVLGFLFMLGWHTRTVGILMLWLYISLITTNPVATDQTDNALRILLFYFLFTDMSQHWSMDARRRTKLAASARRSKMPELPQWLPTILHNGGITAVSIQIFIIYVVAGLSKVQGSQWRDGTAVYYPMKLHSLSPWPALNEVLLMSDLMVNIITYFAVFIQLFFPFLLLARWTRVIGLLGIVSMHAGIGILMGLPLFSMAMMAADGIFIRDRTYASVERYINVQTMPWLRRQIPPNQYSYPSGAESSDKGVGVNTDVASEALGVLSLETETTEEGVHNAGSLKHW